MSEQNLAILPYTTEEDYRNNVNEVLNHLTSKVPNDEIILTEGEYSYIHKRHDVFEYSKEFNIEHRHHKTIANNINSEFLRKIKYIVNIGTWSSAMVCNQFIQMNPNIVGIHIQNSVLPNEYQLDKYENLSRYNTDIKKWLDSQIY